VSINLTGKPDYLYKCRVVRVIDADTLDVSIDVGFQTHIFKRLRLLEVDTYELRDKLEENRKKAQDAKVYVTALCNDCKQVWIKTEMDATGKYGRVLADVYIEGFGGDVIHLNADLVTKGFHEA